MTGKRVYTSYDKKEITALPEAPFHNAGYKIFLDGDSWCAVHSDFVDLQESTAAFGDTPEEALRKLLQSSKPQPNKDLKTIPDECRLCEHPHNGEECKADWRGCALNMRGMVINLDSFFNEPMPVHREWPVSRSMSGKEEYIVSLDIRRKDNDQM